MSKRTISAVKEQVSKRDGKTYYYYRIYEGINPKTGKPKTTTRRGFKSRREAEMAYMKHKAKVDQGESLIASSNQTYKEIYEIWLEVYKHSVEESTLRKTVGYFKNHILPEIGHYKINKINVDICQRFINELSKKLKKASAIKSYASLVFKFAIKRDLIKSNPFNLVDMPKKRVAKGTNKNELSGVLTVEELNELLNVLEEIENKKASTLLRLIACTGMRKGEALALTFCDINYAKKTVTINKAISRGLNNQLYLKSTKTGNTRTVSLDDETLEIIKLWENLLKTELGNKFKEKDQLMFPNENNEYLQDTMPGKWLNQITKKYNLPKTAPHKLRHTHTTHLYQAGIGIKSIQVRLGHDDVKTTLNTYTHINDSMQRETADIYRDFIKARK